MRAKLPACSYCAPPPFVVAALFEIGGAWLVWQGVREQRGWLWAAGGVLALGAYGFVATFQPDAHFGRILAAYGGIFVAGSILWGVVADGYRRPLGHRGGAGLPGRNGPDHVGTAQRRLTTLGGDRPHRPPYAPGAAHGHRSARPSAASRIAVVTGASSGIGAATARQLAAAGYRVVLTARRKDRIEALAEEIEAAGHKATAYPLDVTDREAVDEFATAFKTVGVLVNNAGGALGADPVATGDPDDGAACTRPTSSAPSTSPRPAAEAGGQRRRHGRGRLLDRGPVDLRGRRGLRRRQARRARPGRDPRLEIVGRRVRVIEIAPGMVKTDEFALTRFGGDQDRPAKAHQGVAALLIRRRRRRHHHLGGHPPRPRQHRPPGRPPPRPGLEHQGPPRGLTRAAPRASALHADDLLQLRDDLDQVALLVDDLLDRLVGARDLVQHEVLAALHAPRLLLQVLRGEAPLRGGPADARPAPCEAELKESAVPRPFTMYEPVPMEPGMIRKSPEPARFAPLRVTSRSMPSYRSSAT
ncbi:hypothetical protein SVIOM342S_10184 [Streptomyces violaceorubidus]